MCKPVLHSQREMFAKVTSFKIKVLSFGKSDEYALRMYKLCEKLYISQLLERVTENTVSY